VNFKAPIFKTDLCCDFPCGGLLLPGDWTSHTCALVHICERLASVLELLALCRLRFDLCALNPAKCCEFTAHSTECMGTIVVTAQQQSKQFLQCNPPHSVRCYSLHGDHSCPHHEQEHLCGQEIPGTMFLTEQGCWHYPASIPRYYQTTRPAQSESCGPGCLQTQGFLLFFRARTELEC